MSTLANFMRITDLEVSDHDVDARKAAIATLKSAWGKGGTFETILTKAAAVADALGGIGQPSEALGEEVQAAAQKKASSFLYSERPLEVGIVAGLASIAVVQSSGMSDGWTIADVWAWGLWSALSFQPPLDNPKREELRQHVLEIARNHCRESGEAARARSPVPDFGKLDVGDGEAESVASGLAASSGPTIAALRRNAALDREELDFLWWSLGSRSRLLGKPLRDLSEPVRILAAGIEAANYVRRTPCDVHRDLVLQTLADNPSFTLSVLLAQLGDDRTSLGSGFAGNLPERIPAVFPLLNALLVGDSELPGAELERSLDQWGARALFEASWVKLKAGIGSL